MENDERIDKGLADWQACQPGALRGFAAQQRSSLYRRQLLTVGSAFGAAGLILIMLLRSVDLGGVEPTNSPSVSNQHHVGCAEVLEKVDEYLRDELDVDYARQLREHLDYCPHCKQQYRHRAEELGVELIVQALDEPFKRTLMVAFKP